MAVWYTNLAAPDSWCIPTSASDFIPGFHIGRKSLTLKILLWYTSRRDFGTSSALASILSLSSKDIIAPPFPRQLFFHVRQISLYAAALSSDTFNNKCGSIYVINDSVTTAALYSSSLFRVVHEAAMDAASDPTVAPAAAADSPPGVDSLADRLAAYSPIFWADANVTVVSFVATAAVSLVAASEVVVHNTIQS